MSLSEFDYVRLVSESDGIATLILNRPPLNVIHLPMLEEMFNAFRSVRSTPSYRVLLIRGEGKCFSAGMDVADHLPDKVELMLSLMRKVLHELLNLDIPTVSAIHGSAMGGGLEIAVMTDLTYAVSGTKLAQPEIKLGVFPPVAVAQYSEWMGYKNAAELVFSGRTYTAEEAVQTGLINGVFSPDEFAGKVDQITRQIASYSKPALAAAKQALQKASGWHMMHSLESVEQIYLQRLMKTKDAVEGLKAFLEKRDPQWKHE